MILKQLINNKTFKPITFSEAWDIVFELKIQYLTRNGKDKLGNYKKHLKPTIGHLKLNEITPIHLEYFKNNLLKNLKPQTVKHIIGLVASIYNQLIEWNLYNGTNWLAINDQSLYLISELLGHSDITITKRYAHLSPQKKKSIVSIFDKIK